MIARKSLIEILTFDILLSYYINQIMLNSVFQIDLFELAYKIQKVFALNLKESSSIQIFYRYDLIKRIELNEELFQVFLGVFFSTNRLKLISRSYGGSKDLCHFLISKSSDTTKVF